jgi:hypothetical protein
MTFLGTYKLYSSKNKEATEKAFKKGKEAAKVDVVFLIDLNGDKFNDVLVQQKDGYRYPLTCSIKGGHIPCQRPVERDAKELEKKVNRSK